MAYKSLHIDKLFVVHWLACDPEDLEALLAETASAAAATATPVVFASVMDNRTRRPEARFPQRAIELLDELMQHCRCLYVVDMSTGFKATILRSVLSSMILATSYRRNVTTVDSLSRVVREQAAWFDDSTARIEQELRACGLLAAPTGP